MAQPNILLIMTDEERYPPPYESEAVTEFRRTQMPTRDRLRAGGVELHRHYAGSTACVPSRTDFGQIRPSDWYSGGGFENGFLIADPLDKRYMYTQGWYHVLRRFDRVTNQVVVLYQPTPEDRFGGAPPVSAGPPPPTRSPPSRTG